MLAQEKTTQKIFKDKVLHDDLIFKNSLKVDSLGANLNKTMGHINNAQKIISIKNTIIFTYTPEENENGSLIEIKANNSLHSGVNFDFQTSSGINNKLSLTIVDKNYIYDIGLIQNPIVFALTLYHTKPKLYINGNLVKPIIVNNLLKKSKLGSCPDGWKYLGNNNCQVLQQNKGTCENQNVLKTKKINKSKWSKKCSVNWENCKNLHTGEIAPNSDGSCKPNVDFSISNAPIIFNKNKTLTGRLHNVIIYNNILDNDKIEQIFKYIVQSLLKPKLEDNICSRPSLHKGSHYVSGKECIGNENKHKRSPHYLEEEYKPNDCSEPNSCSKPHTNNKKHCKCPGECPIHPCPFNNSKICNNHHCKNVNWNSLDGIDSMSLGCKNVVNNYCRYNFADSKCNELRNKKEHQSNNHYKRNNKYEYIERRYPVLNEEHIRIKINT